MIATDSYLLQANSYKDIEKNIFTSHSLSYAERMLLVKLRNEIGSQTNQSEYFLIMI
jgi:hypothetical protein